MVRVLALYWQKKNNTIAYMVIDDAIGGVHQAPAQRRVSEQSVGEDIAAIFSDVERYGPVRLEYKIVQHGTPATNIGRPNKAPHQLSIAVLDAVEAGAKRRSISSRSQIKSLLSGAALTVFKRGLHNLQLIDGKHAYEWHLWAVALHATSSNYEGKLKKLWAALNNTSTRTRAGKQNFGAWLRTIAEAQVP